MASWKEQIQEAELRSADCLPRTFTAITRRKLGRSVAPVQITAHHSRILWGYGQMEQSLAGSALVDGTVKHLAEIRVATLVGCPF